MNAIPERAHNYQRASLPKTPPRETTQPYHKVEYMDELRVRRQSAGRGVVSYPQPGRQKTYAAQNSRNTASAAAALGKQQAARAQAQQAARKQQAQQHIGERRRETGRKLTAAYEVGVRNERPRQQAAYQAQRVREEAQARPKRLSVPNAYEARPRQAQPAYSQRRPSMNAGREVQLYERPRQQVYSSQRQYAGMGRELAYPREAVVYERPRQQVVRPAPKKKVEIIGYDGNESVAPRVGSRVAKKGAKPAAAQQRAPRRKGVASTIVLILVVFFILAGTLSRYAALSSVTYQNAQIESEIEQIKQQSEKVKADIASQTTLASVQERASALGMGPAQPEQMNYVQLEDEPAAATEVTLTPQDAAEQGDGGIADFFGGLLQSVKDWFSGLGS